MSYQACKSNFWFYKHKPEVLTEIKVDEFVESLKLQGMEVENFAKKLFPDAVEISSRGEIAALETKDLIKNGEKELFQASFLVDDLFAAVDVLIFNDLYGGWDLYEVKGTTSKDVKREEHYIDATFQKIVLEKAGYKVNNVYLLEVNKEYIKAGAIDPNQLIAQSEVTTEILEREEQIKREIIDARSLIRQKTEPKKCDCIYLSRKNHCSAFEYLYPNVPKYGIHDLNRIGNSKKKLTQLVDDNIFAFEHVPYDLVLTATQTAQINTHLDQQPIIDSKAIEEALSELEYPLYFLDYETLMTAIPIVDGAYPYQQVVMQYSLHIKSSPDAEYMHKEFLHTDNSTPFESVVDSLKKDIGNKGSIIVWYKTFECTRNKELANLVSKDSKFMLDLNERTFDLMTIFSNLHYVKSEFKGSSSIKAVLPVVCPALSYKELVIQNGTDAILGLKKLVTEELESNEKETLKNNLLAYCKLDTWAMVCIYEELLKVIETNDASTKN